MDEPSDIVERAHSYIANNAAESGADVLIVEMAAEIERLRQDSPEVTPAPETPPRMAQKTVRGGRRLWGDSGAVRYKSN
jgi:hypothetical protein